MADLQDVARAAGVSKSTASRALARPELVAEATRDRILRVADELGYRANRSARALTTGRNGLLGLVLPTLGNPFFGPVVLGAQEAAEETDQRVLVAVSEHSPVRELRLLDRLAEQVDGIISVTPRGTERQLRDIANRVPLVLVDRQVPTLPSVLIDTPSGVGQIADHLLGLGHRRLGYLSGPPGSWVDSRRVAILRERVAAANAELTVLGPATPTFDAGADAAGPVREAGLTAVIAFSSLTLLGLRYAFAVGGRSVPGDISVASADDFTLLGATKPGFTALDVPVHSAGRSAVDLVNAKLSGAPVRRPTVLTPTLITRASTAPPPP